MVVLALVVVPVTERAIGLVPAPALEPMNEILVVFVDVRTLVEVVAASKAVFVVVSDERNAAAVAQWFVAVVVAFAEAVSVFVQMLVVVVVTVGVVSVVLAVVVVVYVTVVVSVVVTVGVNVVVNVFVSAPVARRDGRLTNEQTNILKIEKCGS